MSVFRALDNSLTDPFVFLSTKGGKPPLSFEASEEALSTVAGLTGGFSIVPKPGRQEVRHYDSS